MNVQILVETIYITILVYITTSNSHMEIYTFLHKWRGARIGSVSHHERECRLVTWTCICSISLNLAPQKSHLCTFMLCLRAKCSFSWSTDSKSTWQRGHLDLLFIPSTAKRREKSHQIFSLDLLYLAFFVISFSSLFVKLLIFFSSLYFNS